MARPSVGKVATLAGVREQRVIAWQETGLFDRVPPTTEAWVARCHVLAQLERANVPLRVLKAADESDILERAYILEFLQTRRYGEYTLQEVAYHSAIKPETLTRICEALGFVDLTTFTVEELAFFRALGEALNQGVPEAMVLETCELWGTQMRYIAAAEVVSYDTNLARRVMSEAPSPIEGASKIAPLTRSILKAADLLPMPLHHRHLLQALNLRTTGNGVEGDPLAPGEVDVAIGFIDLSGFTRLTREEGDSQALVYSRRLELAARRAERAGGPHIVKRLGDGIMVASSTVLGMLPGIIGTVEAISERNDMPAARGSVAWGRARTQAGDYFGHTVNLAARLLDHARPAEVLVTDEVLDEAAGGPFTFVEPRDLKLRGIGEPVRAWRVLRDQETKPPIIE